MRQTSWSSALCAGADVRIVQAVAGHASPVITLRRCSHLPTDRVTEAAGRFDSARVAE
jgi:hypothetical protein